MPSENAAALEAILRAADDLMASENYLDARVEEIAAYLDSQGVVLLNPSEAHNRIYHRRRAECQAAIMLGPASLPEGLMPCDVVENFEQAVRADERGRTDA